MTIDIACQTYCLRTCAPEEMLVAARKAGFRGLELWVGHADWCEGRDGALRIRRAAADVGLALQAYSVGGFVREALATVETRLGQAFDYAGALGVDLVTGVIDRRAVPVVEDLCRRTGLRFGIENHWYADFAHAADYADVLADASPLVGVTLDTGHATAAGERPADALATLGARVFAVHLKDVAVPRRLVRWLRGRARMEGRTIGTGDAELPAFLAAVARGGWRGSLALEDERPDLLLSELATCRRVGLDLLRAAVNGTAVGAGSGVP